MNTNVKVIGLTRLGIEPQVYRSRSRRSIPLGICISPVTTRRKKSRLKKSQRFGVPLRKLLNAPLLQANSIPTEVNCIALSLMLQLQAGEGGFGGEKPITQKLADVGLVM